MCRLSLVKQRDSEGLVLSTTYLVAVGLASKRTILYLL